MNKKINEENIVYAAGSTHEVSGWIWANEQGKLVLSDNVGLGEWVKLEPITVSATLTENHNPFNVMLRTIDSQIEAAEAEYAKRLCNLREKRERLLALPAARAHDVGIILSTDDDFPF